MQLRGGGSRDQFGAAMRAMTALVIRSQRSPSNGNTSLNSVSTSSARAS
jgi:hypothetical protein